MEKGNEIKIQELETILYRLNLSNKVLEEVLDYIRNKFNFIDLAAIKAYDGEVPNFTICKHRPFTRLSIVCFKLIVLKQEYKNKGIPESIFFDTIQDIRLRQELYYEENKKIGLSKDDVIWFRHLFNMHIFKLNTLQFQLFNMIYLDKDSIGEEYMTFREEQKDKLPPGSPVVNIHIQRNADLNPVEVEKSLNIALDFFQEYYPEHGPKAFVCYSWLLYSGNQKLLDKDSNIIKFAKRFEIISEVQDDKQAIQNIYGKRFRKKKDYPANTSLQQNALIYPKCLGMSCGVIYIYLLKKYTIA